MAKIILTATPCEFTEYGFKFDLMGPVLARETVEARDARGLQTAADELAARAAEAHPGREFFVSHTLARGERAFSGYRKLPHRLHNQRNAAAA